MYKPHIPIFPSIFAAMLFIVACDNIDCPLNNTVYATYNFYDIENEQPTTLKDTLTVQPFGKDTILLNRIFDVSSINLPVSHTGEADTLLFHFSSPSGKATDTIVFVHTNIPHFVSIDCATAVFHTVTHVAWKKQTIYPRPQAIDSIALVDPQINYDPKEHFKIFTHTSDR